MFDPAVEAYVDNNSEELINKAQSIYDAVPAELRHSNLHLVDGFSLMLEQEKFEQAEQILNMLYENELPAGRFHRLKALLFQKTKSFEDAALEYHKALKVRPTAIAHYHLAVNYWWMGKQQLVLEHLERARELNRNLNSVNTLLAGMYLQQGNLSDSIKIYEEISTSSPGGVTFTNLAVAYMLNREYEKSLKFSKLALEDDPNHAGRLINYADSLLLLGSNEDAERIYTKVVDITSGQRDLINLTRLAQAYLHLQNHSSALKTISEAKNIAPSNPNVLFVSALVLSEIKEENSALINIEQALQQGMGKVWFHLPWFDSLCQNEDFRALIKIEGLATDFRC